MSKSSNLSQTLFYGRNPSNASEGFFPNVNASSNPAYLSEFKSFLESSDVDDTNIISSIPSMSQVQIDALSGVVSVVFDDLENTSQFSLYYFNGNINSYLPLILPDNGSNIFIPKPASVIVSNTRNLLQSDLYNILYMDANIPIEIRIPTGLFIDNDEFLTIVLSGSGSVTIDTIDSNVTNFIGTSFIDRIGSSITLTSPSTENIVGLG